MNTLRVALARSLLATGLGAACGVAVLLLLGHVSAPFVLAALVPRLLGALLAAAVGGALGLRPSALVQEDAASRKWARAASLSAAGIAVGWLFGGLFAGFGLWGTLRAEGLLGIAVATLGALPAVIGATFAFTLVDAAAKAEVRRRSPSAPPWPRASLRRRLFVQTLLIAMAPPAFIGLTLFHFIAAHGEPAAAPMDHGAHRAPPSGQPKAAPQLSGRGVSSHDHAALLALVGLLIFASGAIAARLSAALAGAMSEPIEDLLRGLERVRDGDTSHRLSVLTGDEVGRAAGLFNQMAARVAERAFLQEAFGRYVSREVADAILDGRITTAGAQLDVSLLFADIRGFTTLSEKMPPVDLLRFLNAYLARMIDVVSAQGGRLDKVMGDGLFFVFGAPIPDEAHARRAVEAALAMRDALAAFNAEAAAEGRPALRIGIGVHSGTVVAGSIGSSRHKLEYTVLGDAVNVAARVEGLTKEFDTDILVTAATQASVANRFRFERMPSAAVKGRAAPVQTFRVERLA